MHRILILIIGIGMYLSGSDAFGQDQATALAPDLLGKWMQVGLSSRDLWLYKPGDDPEWADPGLPAEGWLPINIRMPENQMPENWTGIGWLRASIRIDSALFDKEIAIHGDLHGAMDLYVNGQLVATAGKVGNSAETEYAVGYLEPTVFRFSNNEYQSFAIRYSNYAAQSFWNHSPSGINLYIGYPDKVGRVSSIRTDNLNKEDNRFYMLFGILVALAMLHLILFVYYPAERANLLCALFFFCISGIFLPALVFNYEDSPVQFINNVALEGIFLILSAVILPFFIYEAINRKVDWLPKTILAGGVVTMTLLFINPVVYQYYNYLLFLISTSAGIGLILYARFKLKMYELNIIIAFYLISLILLLPGLIETVFDYPNLWSGNPLFMNLSAIPVVIGYSFYLARGVAMTNKRLSEKLSENEILSNAKLKAEVEKQQLIEEQKTRLEAEVADRTQELSDSLEKLKATQAQLIQQEKLASLGELTAGIAHEIQNPLNFVNNFSELNTELINELEEEVKNGNLEEAMVLAKNIIANEEKITHHGKRAEAIVKGMLMHSRSSSGEKVKTDINALADEYLRLAYHGLRAKDKSFNAKMETNFDPEIGEIEIVPQEIGRALLNLITNAFYAVNEKRKQEDESFTPVVTVSTRKSGKAVEITVADNGNGIPQNVIDKIFQPFFTTKPTGQGTGLGLSLSYDIVKAHGGELSVNSQEGEGTSFTLAIPV